MVNGTETINFRQMKNYVKGEFKQKGKINNRILRTIIQYEQTENNLFR